VAVQVAGCKNACSILHFIVKGGNNASLQSIGIIHSSLIRFNFVGT
jgi:hypothetical protein